MLEGTIKLHGEEGCGKSKVLRFIEQALTNDTELSSKPLRIVCKTQLPGQPESVAVTFTRKAPGDKLRANWTRS